MHLVSFVLLLVLDHTLFKKKCKNKLNVNTTDFIITEFDTTELNSKFKS